MKPDEQPTTNPRMDLNFTKTTEYVCSRCQFECDEPIPGKIRGFNLGGEPIKLIHRLCQTCEKKALDDNETVYKCDSCKEPTNRRFLSPMEGKPRRKGKLWVAWICNECLFEGKKAKDGKGARKAQ